MTRKLEDILNLPNVKEAFAKVDDKEKSRDDKDKPTIPRMWIRKLPRHWKKLTRNLTR